MNRILTVFSTVFLAISVFSCNSENDNISEDTVKMLEEKPFDGITDSIEQQPQDAMLRLRRAGLLSQNNIHELATNDYKKAWELVQDENTALMYVSNLLLTDAVKHAEKLLEECSKKFPDNTEFDRRLGEIHVQKGEYNKALESFNKILSRDSGNFEAWYDKGSLLIKMKDTLGAIESLEASFSQMPINYSGMLLANLYISQKDSRALDICDFLLSKDSSETQLEPLFTKGVYYVETKEYDKALRLFDECIRRDWKMTDAYIEKGIILFERKKINEALKVFNMATTVSNTDPDAYYWLGRCYEMSGNRSEAIINYQRAFSLDDTFNEAKAALQRLNG